MFSITETGKKIQILRKEANLTQMELANRLGISFQAVSNWERGVSMPDISNLGQLAEILSTTVDELIGDKTAVDIINGNPCSTDMSVEEFNAVSPLLLPEENRELLDRITNAGDSDTSSVNIASCAYSEEEFSDAMKSAYEKEKPGKLHILAGCADRYADKDVVDEIICDAAKNGKTGMVTILCSKASDEAVQRCFDTAFDSGNIGMVTILMHRIPKTLLATYAAKAAQSGNFAMTSILTAKISSGRKCRITISESDGDAPTEDGTKLMSVSRVRLKELQSRLCEIKSAWNREVGALTDLDDEAEDIRDEVCELFDETQDCVSELLGDIDGALEDIPE